MIKLLQIFLLIFSLLISPFTMAEGQNLIEVSTVIEQYNGKNYYLHTVEAKQTIYAISKAYQVTPEAVLMSNPAARHGIRINQVLRIPMESTTNESVNNVNVTDNQPAILKDFDFIYHVAITNDKFSYISEIYLVSENNIRLANPNLSEPLKQGDYVKVPISPIDKKPLVAEEQFKRTKYDPYNEPKSGPLQATRADLTNADKKTEDVKLVSPFEIPKEKQTIKPTEKQTTKPTAKETTPKAESSVKQHIVKPKETIYSISRLYGLSADDLRNANSGLGDAIKIGQVLVIPTDDKINQSAPVDKSLQAKTISTTTEIVKQDKPAVVQEVVKDSIVKYHVKKGETLYSIARNNAVSIDELKSINKGLTQQLRVGQEILIPKKKNNSPFIQYTVTKDQKTIQVANDFDISVERLKKSNPSVGKKVSAGQKLNIPISDNLRPTPLQPSNKQIVNANMGVEKAIFTDNNQLISNAEVDLKGKTFKVALMIPLYLEQVDSMALTATTNPDLFGASLPFTFIQFYEGFMIAVDSLVKTKGLKLELMVFDVDQDQQKVDKVLIDNRLIDSDLIVGPFFGSTFEKVAQFASEHKIPIVNPVSSRPEIVKNNPFVIKVKPGDRFQYEQISQLINLKYPDSKVFIYRANGFKFTEESAVLKDILTKNIPSEVNISNERMMELVAERSRRRHLPDDQFVSSIAIEGQKFMTDQLQVAGFESTKFLNPVTELIYSNDSIRGFTRKASTVRQNIVIAFADENVFAMEFVNKMNQLADTFDIRLVGIPNWEKFGNLFVDNLMRMNAVFITPSYINRSNRQSMQFILQFKNRYHLDPNEYAFEGFDIGYYFMDAMMSYGRNMTNSMDKFSGDLLQTGYLFSRDNESDGLVNQYWNFIEHTDYQLNSVKFDHFIKK